MENITKLLDEKRLKCKIEHKRLILIYLGIINEKEELLKYIVDIVGKQEKIITRHAISSGPSKSYQNVKGITICLLEFSDVFRSNNTKIFDYPPNNPLHPIIRYTTNIKNFDRCVGIIANDIDDVPDTNVDYHNSNDVIRVFDITNYPYPWQKELLEILKTPINVKTERVVYWYYDPVGNTGKTEMTKYLVKKYGSDIYVSARAMSGYHSSTLIENAIDWGWSGKIFLFDLPRHASEIETLYESMECIKNGITTSSKYVGKTLIFKNDFLIVFANFLPDITQMSLDRWIIKKIKKENYKTINHKELLITYDYTLNKNLGKVIFNDDNNAYNLVKRNNDYDIFENPKLMKNEIDNKTLSSASNLPDDINLPLSTNDDVFDRLLALGENTDKDDHDNFNLPLDNDDYNSIVSNNTNINIPFGSMKELVENIDKIINEKKTFYNGKNTEYYSSSNEDY
jgi:hypothetical protein